MNIFNSTEFINAFSGGILIGFGSLLLMFFYGRIAGISGILFSGLDSLASLSPKSIAANLAPWFFIIGLMLGSSAYYIWAGKSFPEAIANMPMAILAGLLVGIGTNLGNGCTSGHGVCGMSRLSLRSIVATVTFIFFGMLTVGGLRYAF